MQNALIQRLGGLGGSWNTSCYTIMPYHARRLCGIIGVYVEKSLHMKTKHGSHIRAMKLMRIGKNQEAMMLLEPVVHMNDFALMLYIDILLFGRQGIERNIDKCEQLLYQRFGIDNSTEIDITSLLNLRIQYHDPNLLGLLYLLRKFEPIKYTCSWKGSMIVNAHLLAWSRGSLYGELAMMSTLMIERRCYVRELKDDVLVKFKTDVFFGTADEGCRYENYASLARQINDKYNHPFAQCFLIKNLKYKYDQQVVPPEILCEMDHFKQKALLQGFNEEHMEVRIL
jgi:hypothetical protein